MLDPQWEFVDAGPVPGGGTMELLRWRNELIIRVDGRELMCNKAHGSEDALADLAFDRLGDRPTARILVGGFGMGFTLAAALRRLPPDGTVVVAELVPVIIKWNEGVVGEVAGFPLKDPRASVHQGDVADLIRAEPRAWDAILLDVDNGPVAVTAANNNWLYSWQGLAAAFRALRPGGVLGVWSAHGDRGFTRRFQRAGFDVEAIDVRARGTRGGRLHVVWMGIRHNEPPRWTPRLGMPGPPED